MAIDPSDLDQIRNRDLAALEKALFDGFINKDERRAYAAHNAWMSKYKFRLSVPIKPEELESAYKVGMIRRAELIDGAYYFGVCRNAHVAMWSELLGAFVHNRKKLGGWRVEIIRHPENERFTQDPSSGKLQGEDVFMPFAQVEAKGWEIVDPAALEKVLKE